MALAAFGSGCLGGDDQVRAATGAAREIANVVQSLERATVRGDWKAVCEDLLTEAARERAGGPRCLRRTRAAAAQIKRPAIEITAIKVRGRRAAVGVRTTAEGQAELRDLLQLRREGGEWRVEALSEG